MRSPRRLMATAAAAIVVTVGTAAAARGTITRGPVPAQLVTCPPADSSMRLARDSARTELRRLIVRVQFAQDRALRYARIVQRTPSQAKYLNGWMRRAFDGVLPEAHR
jgi:hypothetical protein